MTDMDDLDFVVVKAETCDNFVAQRCMFSGETLGLPSDQCTGETGLDFESVDLYEDPGCSSGSDNFLAALEVEQGDVIYLLVINFAQLGNLIEVEYTGTAELCESLQSTGLAASPLDVFPNPTSEYIDVKTKLEEPQSIVIRGVDGRIYIESSYLPRIDVSNLPEGIYYIELKFLKRG